MKVPMILTFDLLTSKSIYVFYYSVPTSIASFKTIGPSVPSLLVKQAFCHEGPCDLDIWPTDLKINMGLLLLGTNLHIKFQDNRPKRSLVIGQTSFLLWRSLWPNDAKINMCILLLGTNLHIKFQDNMPKHSLVIGQTSFLLWRSLPPWP